MTGCGGGGGNSDTQPPSQPSGLSGTSQDGAVDLSWSALSTGDLSGYNVYRATSTIEEVSELDPQNDDPVSKASYTDTGADNGTTYYYAVTAVDEAGNESGPSDPIEKAAFAGPPGQP
ncbi:MAG: fibronectin type III domain-containing protein [Bacteroidetes bacterium SW_9_63_38]|nr:MAG: fibronectin type III domain-containing protein [Bacteroidetes bacterium SW_9_63_38]